jgi:hypothetical protein
MQFIRNLSGNGYKTLWYHEGTYYYVSSVFHIDVPISETMVFESDENGNVSNWSELYVCGYTEDHQSVMEQFLNAD